MTNVVVGGGISGMLSAYFLATQSNNQVYLVEREKQLGGLLRCFDYGDTFGRFDYGAHNILMTGIEELDELLKSLLPADDWEYISALPDEINVYSGIYSNGNLNIDSTFLNLKGTKNINELRADFLNNFEKNQGLSYENAYEFSKSLFGDLITDEHIVPVFFSLYDTHPKDMDYMSMYLTSLTRIGLFDEKVSNELLKTENLSKILAYPYQEKLTQEQLGRVRRALYPKDYGIYRVISALETKLIDAGVKVYKNSEITDITIIDKNIDSVEINSNLRLDSIKQLVFSGNIVGLAKMLKLNLDLADFKMPFDTVITNVLLDKPLVMGELSYFYNYDKNFETYRVDNYAKYCSGAVRNDLYPVSIEMLLNKDKKLTVKDIEKMAVEELIRFGIVSKDTTIKFVKTEVLNYGFPYLSRNNIKIIDNVRNEIENQGLLNLMNVGILSKKDLFFENDVKTNAYYKIQEFLNV